MGLIAAIIAVFWLLHRATRLLKIPATTLIRLLGVDIPESPDLCVDHVGDSSITLRWPKPDKATTHKHIIEVNGLKAGESSRSTSVILTNLHPDKTYAVNVLAVNANQYRSNTTTVRVHTRKRVDHPTLDSLAPVLVDPPSFVVLSSATSGATESSSESTTASSGNKAKRHKQGSNKKLTPDKSAYTVESLTEEVEAAQQEIREATLQFREVEKEFLATEAKLQEELAELRAQRRKDDIARSQLRSEMKALEDQKLAIELQRTKIEKQINNLELTQKRMGMEESKWTNTSQIINRKMEDLMNADTDAFQEQVNKKSLEVESLKEALSLADEEVKNMTSEARQLETLRKRLAEHGNNRNYDSSTADELMKTLDETSDGKAEILRQQIHFDTDLDQKWRDVQRQLEQRYVQVYGEYGEATRLLESAKIQYQQFQVVTSANNSNSQIFDHSSFDYSAANRELRENHSRSQSDIQSNRESIRHQTTPSAQPATTVDNGRRVSTFEGDDNFNTAVKMFLPSNLFGADDLDDSLTQSSFEELPVKQPVLPNRAQTSSPSSSFDAFRVSETPNSPSLFSGEFDMDTSSPAARPKRMFGFHWGKGNSDKNNNSLFFRGKGKSSQGKEPNEDEHSFDPFEQSWNRSSSPANIFGHTFGPTWSGSSSTDQDWRVQPVESYRGEPGTFTSGFKPFHNTAADNQSEHSVLTDGSKDSNSKESIIQKGIRTLTSPRKGSSSSSKFSVGKLNFFGSRKSDRSDGSSTDLEDAVIEPGSLGSLGPIHEARSGAGSPHLNMEEFLKQA